MPGRRRGWVRVEFFMSSWLARAQNGSGDGRESGNSSRGRELGDERGKETGLGKNDAQCDAHRRPEPRGIEERGDGTQRHKYDPERDGRESRHATAGTLRGGLHDAGWIFLAECETD